jgi:hypothetical protein
MLDGRHCSAIRAILYVARVRTRPKRRLAAPAARAE